MGQLQGRIFSTCRVAVKSYFFVDKIAMVRCKFLYGFKDAPYCA